MEKIKNIKNLLQGRIVGWSLRKKIIYGVVLLILILIAYSIFKPKDNSANITTSMASVINLKQTILATGQVTSNTDLNLSFYSSGMVRSLKAKVGDVVKTGQILATLDQKNESASLTQARGGVAAAEARYQSILDGVSNEEIQLSQIALDNAKQNYDLLKSQQDTLVDSAYKNLLNSTPEALPSGGISDNTAPTLSGNYSLGKEGEIHVTIYYTGNGASFMVSGVATGNGVLTTTTPQALGNSGLYIKFPSTTAITNTEWIIKIPNTKAVNYETNLSAYQAAQKAREATLGSAQSLIDQRIAELTLKKATARPADVELAKANILTAQGQYELASANFEHTILRAPADGTITKVNIKLGELAQAQKEVMVLQDINNIYLEANVNEANVTSVKNDASVDVTFDAFGSDQIYKGKIISIDPASTVISGVVNYKIKASISNMPGLRPGMTANMTILAGEKDGVLTIPTRAVLKDKTGKKTVRLVTNPKTKTFKEVNVETGMEGDGGLVEITSGLVVDDEVVVLIKK